MSTAKKTSFKQDFISRVVREPINWPREMKILKKILPLYEEESFWGSVNVTFKVPSLAFFLTDRGASLLQAEYKKFKFEPEKAKVYEVSTDIYFSKDETSDQKTQTTKPKSLNDFLKIWKK
jgi:hypothetical protein